MSWRARLILLGAAAAGACHAHKKPWPFVVGQSAGVTLVTERPEAEGRLRNATLNYGAFFINKDCLQVRVGTLVFTPVLPRGSSISADKSQLAVAGRLLEMGRRYSLPFATEVGRTPGEAASALGVPSRCSQRLMSMGAPA